MNATAYARRQDAVKNPSVITGCPDQKCSFDIGCPCKGNHTSPCVSQTRKGD